MRQWSADEIAAAAKMARTDLYFFSRWMFERRRGYQWIRGRHHQLICDALTRVFNGQSTRLIINVPPRYSKTELAVVNFMAWALGKVPDAEFIHTSYSGRLASNNAWQCRELVACEPFRQIFPETRLRQDSKAKDEWRTTQGGIVYATGAGGTITGYGAGKHRPGFGGAILIDDPHKADEARSDTIRQGVIEWFQNTLESRRNSPTTPIILIMQRLHEKDLAGWLLDGGNGEKWDHVILPAMLDEETALWPEKHPITELKRMRNAAPYTFAGQYMQAPAPPEGNIIKPDQIEVVDAVPDGTTFVRAWDLAATIDGGDWTVGLKLGMTPTGRPLIADIVRLQGSPDQVQAAIVNAAKRDGNSVRVKLPQDPGQAGKAQVAYLTRMLTGYPVTSGPVTGDKITRAEPVAAQINVGNVQMLRAPWNDAFIAEGRLFPNGLHDDQIDALADAFDASSNNVFGMLDFMRQQVAERKDKDPATEAQPDRR
jgi:predicted phage terminase large subunit-like protein